jgi:putative DNA modification/repair radical SAM protein
MEFERKLQLLTEGAKYDVSCSSSGSERVNPKGALGNTVACGVCHSFTADGRCISLLKILMSNACIYDCKYCINKVSNSHERATLTPDELCNLTINFYKRNYIEGLFLSSAIVKNPEYTMQLLLKTVKKLREEYNFGGYIHLKGIAGAESSTINEAAQYADRMSFNAELPTEESLQLLAPQKNLKQSLLHMKHLNFKELEYKSTALVTKPQKTIPAGQSTQFVVGATKDTDGTILGLTQNLYNHFKLKRVYYSAYIPVNNNPLLPNKPESLVRENRLYQADWLLRFYGFTKEEIVEDDENLNLEIDPKAMYAIKNLKSFPLEVNTSTREELLRVPGIGVTGAYRIITARKLCKLNFDDLKKMGIVLKRAKHFITANGKFTGFNDDPQTLFNLLSGENNAEGFMQLSLFDTTKRSLLLT